MSVAAAVASTSEPRSFSIGPLKIQIMTLAAVSGDVSATATAPGLSTIFHSILTGGFVETAAVTISGNVATHTFTDPAANRFGTIICIGR